MSDPIVLLPGMMCDARLFAPQIAMLSATRTVQISPITRGESIEEIASLVLEYAPDRFALAGFSMGGIVAMEVARQRPDRVLRLALMDTTPFSETPQVAAAREPQIVAAKAGRLEDVMRDEMLPRYILPDGPKNVEIANTVIDMAMALGPDVFVRQSRALQRRPDQQEMLKQLKLQTLILCGRHDQLCPLRRHELMATLVKGSALEVIEDAAHLPTLEQPEATNAALERWLSGTLLLKEPMAT